MYFICDKQKHMCDSGFSDWTAVVKPHDEMITIWIFIYLSQVTTLSFFHWVVN